MKQIIIVICMLVLFFGWCHAQESAKTEQKPGAETKMKTQQIPYEKIALAELSEKELLKLLKVWPAVKADILNLKIDIFTAVLEGHYKSSDELLRAFLEPYAQINKKIPGLDAKLQAAGMPWNEFMPAFIKTMTMQLFVGLSSNMNLGSDYWRHSHKKENEEQLKDPKTSENNKEWMRHELYLIELYERVPKNSFATFGKQIDQVMEMFDNY